jgi:hypothetical protein
MRMTSISALTPIIELMLYNMSITFATISIIVAS